MRLSSFDYELPEAQIAQAPLADRSSARLLVGSDPVRHRRVTDLPELLGPGDVIVVNNTRVLPARLRLHKSTGGAVEVFLLSPVDGTHWEALVRPSRRVADGTLLFDDDDVARVQVVGDRGEGRRVVAPAPQSGSVDADVVSLLDHAMAQGEVPLPPYIETTLDDPDRYQTVYADRVGSVAAPTAGLHFTDALLDECRAVGAEIHSVELQVGIGTFRPIVVDDVSEHTMHAERYVVPDATWDACAVANRVIAVGTTSVRALETAAATGERTGSSELFISPGFDWQVVDALLTNFHLPKSSLLVMLAAFCGERWRDLYTSALAEGYRFLSFGDAMFVERAVDAEKGER